MSDHSKLRYLFEQTNINAKKSRWWAILKEFGFQIRYVKGNENKVVDDLSRRVQVNEISAVSSYGKYFYVMKPTLKKIEKID